MFQTIGGRTADEVWRKAVDLFRDERLYRQHSSRAGLTRDLGHIALTISDPRQRWVISREPAMNPAFAIAEVIWILNGRNDAAFLNFFNRQLPVFAGNGKTYDGAYGRRLRNHFGVDQLDRAYQALRYNPQTRQVVLQIWDGRVDLPASDGSPSSPDVPCNIVSLLKVRGDKLEWTQVIRSNDLFRGLPHNLVQFTALQEVMAGWLGIEVGDFHLVTDSLHFYETDSSIFECGSPLEIVESQESLALPKDESEKAFRILGDTVERIIDPATSPRALLEELDIVELPQEFRNLLCVLLAEGLRRRRQRELVRDAMRSCHSSVYNHLWNRWQSRMERSRRPIEDGEVEFLASEGDRYAK